MFDRAAIAKEAHRVARLYAREVGYRKALSWGFKQAWAAAKSLARIMAADAELTAAQRARRDERIIIECSTDLLTTADHARLTELAHAA